jgi:hypothetical protein
MSQLRRILCLGLAVSIIGMLPCVPLRAAEPQADKADWENLKQLAPGTKIQVVLNDAKSYSGEYQSRTDEAIVVRLATGEQTFNRQSVLRVSSKGKSHRWWNVAIGAAIGAAVGAGIGAANPGILNHDLSPGQGKGNAAGAFAFLGFAGGAAVGAALPTGGWKEVYRAR